MERCPFCGAEGRLDSFTYPKDGHGSANVTLFYVRCTECEDLTTLDSEVAEKAVSHWNHRVFSKETLMLREPRKVENINNDCLMALAKASVEACKKEYINAYRNYVKKRIDLEKAEHGLDSLDIKNSPKRVFIDAYKQYQKALTRLFEAEYDVKRNLFICTYIEKPYTVVNLWRDQNPPKELSQLENNPYDRDKDYEWDELYDKLKKQIA